jgi:nucleotide-binding universal stress UspA family protein
MSQAKRRFSKILVAIDGSQPSMHAADYAVAIAKKEEGTIQLIALHVIFSQIGYAYSSSGAFGGRLVTPSSIKKILEGAKI